jgi:sulfotransferase
MGYIARQVFQTEEAKAVDMKHVLEPMYLDFVRAGCDNAYNSLTDRPVVIDKSRSWIGHLDQLYKVWKDAKVLVPVRDIRGILSSMEKKRRQHPQVFSAAEQQSPANWTTIEKRVNGWLQTPPIGIAIERVYEAKERFGDKLMFVHADDLTSNPQEVMNAVWEYLGEEPFIHNTSNVEQYTKEHDIGFPYGDHVIRKEVKPLKNDWHEILGRQLSEQLNQKFNWINEL